MCLTISIAIFVCEFFQNKTLGLDSDICLMIYLISQFIIGFCQYSLDIAIFVLFIEMTSLKYGSFVSIFNLTLFSFGEFIILAISYYFRNWHYQNLFIAIYALITSMLIILILPESPKFLIVNNRFQEASVVLTRIAKFNGNNHLIMNFNNTIIHEKNLKRNEGFYFRRRNNFRNERRNS